MTVVHFRGPSIGFIVAQSNSKQSIMSGLQDSIIAAIVTAVICGVTKESLATCVRMGMCPKCCNGRFAPEEPSSSPRSSCHEGGCCRTESSTRPIKRRHAFPARRSRNN